MNIPLFSIIIPVYKVEQYLPECIDSIIKQTFTNFELLLIDDGSPDRSAETVSYTHLTLPTNSLV